MPDLSVTIDDIDIADQKVVYTVTFAGTSTDTVKPKAAVAIKVYDASGTERWSQDEQVAEGSSTAPQRWETALPTDLDDGDYAAWAWASIWDDSDDDTTLGPDDHKVASQGVNFLVGRGRIYASTRPSLLATRAKSSQLGDPRLQGTWIVTDVTNTAAYDVSTSHSLNLFLGTDLFGEVKGEELVHANATQQINHLLPEGMPDGRYTAVVVVRPEGRRRPRAREVRRAREAGRRPRPSCPELAPLTAASGSSAST